MNTFLLIAFVWVLWKFLTVPRPNTEVRANQKHKRLINRKWFRVYYSGAYAWLEIDFGRVGHHGFVILLGCTDRCLNINRYRRRNL
jgi:hypothetical protein